MTQVRFNEDQTSVGSPGNSQFKCEPKCRNNNDVIQRRNPFSKSLSLKRKEKPTPSHVSCFKFGSAVAGHDVPNKLHANIKHVTSSTATSPVASPQECGIKKPRTHPTTVPCGTHLTQAVLTVSSPSSSVCSQTELSPEANAILESYFGHLKCSANSDNNFTSDHISGINCARKYPVCVSTPKEKSSLSRLKVPLFPTFSPKKRIPSTSPVILDAPDMSEKTSAIGKNTFSSPLLFSSPAPFSTPAQPLDSSIASTGHQSKKSRKRILFPQKDCPRSQHGSPNTSPSTDNKPNSRRKEEDFSFGMDLSFPEVSNYSESERSFKSPTVNNLNYYLVLELVTQASTNIGDHGRSDIFSSIIFV